MFWSQIAFESSPFEPSEELISIWPSMSGYCIHLNGTDMFYDLKHVEVLGDTFNPGRVLNQMRMARSLKEGDRPTIFRDTSLNH